MLGAIFNRVKDYFLVLKTLKKRLVGVIRRNNNID